MLFLIRRLRLLQRRLDDPKMPSRLEWASEQRKWILRCRRMAPQVQKVIRGYLTRIRLQRLRLAKSRAIFESQQPLATARIAKIIASNAVKAAVSSSMRDVSKSNRPMKQWTQIVHRCISPVATVLHPASTLDFILSCLQQSNPKRQKVLSRMHHRSSIPVRIKSIARRRTEDAMSRLWWFVRSHSSFPDWTAFAYLGLLLKGTQRAEFARLIACRSDANRHSMHCTSARGIPVHVGISPLHDQDVVTREARRIS